MNKGKKIQNFNGKVKSYLDLVNQMGVPVDQDEEGQIDQLKEGGGLPKAQNGLNEFCTNAPIINSGGKVFAQCRNRDYDSEHDFELGAAMSVGKLNDEFTSSFKGTAGYTFNPSGGTGGFKGYVGANYGKRATAFGDNNVNMNNVSSGVLSGGYTGEMGGNSYNWQTPTQYEFGAYADKDLIGDNGTTFGGYGRLGLANAKIGYNANTGPQFSIGLGLPIKKHGGEEHEGLDGVTVGADGKLVMNQNSDIKNAIIDESYTKGYNTRWANEVDKNISGSYHLYDKPYKSDLSNMTELRREGLLNAEEYLGMPSEYGIDSKRGGGYKYMSGVGGVSYLGDRDLIDPLTGNVPEYLSDLYDPKKHNNRLYYGENINPDNTLNNLKRSYFGNQNHSQKSFDQVREHELGHAFTNNQSLITPYAAQLLKKSKTLDDRSDVSFKEWKEQEGLGKRSLGQMGSDFLKNIDFKKGDTRKDQYRDWKNTATGDYLTDPAEVYTRYKKGQNHLKNAGIFDHTTGEPFTEEHYNKVQEWMKTDDFKNADSDVKEFFGTDDYTSEFNKKINKPNLIEIMNNVADNSEIGGDDLQQGMYAKYGGSLRKFQGDVGGSETKSKATVFIGSGRNGMFEDDFERMKADLDKKYGVDNYQVVRSKDVQRKMNSDILGNEELLDFNEGDYTKALHARRDLSFQLFKKKNPNHDLSKFETYEDLEADHFLRVSKIKRDGTESYSTADLHKVLPLYQYQDEHGLKTYNDDKEWAASNNNVHDLVQARKAYNKQNRLYKNLDANERLNYYKTYFENMGEGSDVYMLKHGDNMFLSDAGTLSEGTRSDFKYGNTPDKLDTFAEAMTTWGPATTGTCYMGVCNGLPGAKHIANETGMTTKAQKGNWAGYYDRSGTYGDDQTFDEKFFNPQNKGNQQSGGYYNTYTNKDGVMTTESTGYMAPKRTREEQAIEDYYRQASFKYGGQLPKAQDGTETSYGQKLADSGMDLIEKGFNSTRPSMGVYENITEFFGGTDCHKDRTCVQAVRDIYENAGFESGIPQEIYDNESFSENYKDYGYELVPTSDRQPGDLLQYYYKNGAVDRKFHMGIYVGDNNYVGDGDPDNLMSINNIYEYNDGRTKEPFNVYRKINTKKYGGAPSSREYIKHTIVKGDSGKRLKAMYGTELKDVLKHNDLKYFKIGAEIEIPKYQSEGAWNDFEKSSVGKFVDAKGLRQDGEHFMNTVGNYFGYEADEGKDLALDATAIINPAADFIHAGTKFDEGEYTDAALYGIFGILPFSAGPLVSGTKKVASKVKNFFNDGASKLAGETSTHVYNPASSQWIEKKANKIKSKLLVNDINEIATRDYFQNKVIKLEQGKIKIANDIKKFKSDNPGVEIPKDLLQIDKVVNNQIIHYSKNLEKVINEGSGNMMNEKLLKQLNLAEKLDMERVIGDYKWDNRNTFQKYFNTPTPPK